MERTATHIIITEESTVYAVINPYMEPGRSDKVITVEAYCPVVHRDGSLSTFGRWVDLGAFPLDTVTLIPIGR